MIQYHTMNSDSVYHDTVDPDAHVVIIGGGTMGGGIAASLLSVGSVVTLVETNQDLADAAHARVNESITRMSRKNDSLDVEDALGRFTAATTHPTTPVVLVIEAVPEDLALKRSVFEAIASHYPSDVIFASNTSSLSITAIADAMPAPDRFVGMHFFNPVPVSSLVEIVVGADTSDATTATTTAWVEHLGKTPIVVRDSPGFASSRLGIALGMEAIRMVEEGVASAGDIDSAMVLGYKHPIGPLRLTDLVGLDVRLAIAEHLAVELGPRFEPPALLRQMVADGLLGKKSGQGFHTW